MADDTIALTKMVLAQVLLVNPFMKLLCLHHLIAAQVVIVVIGWLGRHRNELKHSRGQITREIWLKKTEQEMN